jgi:hypothetical protein
VGTGHGGIDIGLGGGLYVGEYLAIGRVDGLEAFGRRIGWQPGPVDMGSE